MDVEAYHRKSGIKLPNALVHAVIHVIVENQIALGDETSTRATLECLMHEGLDRHEAVHAVGSVFIGIMHSFVEGDETPDPKEKYDQELEKLTAAEWRKSFEKVSYWAAWLKGCRMSPSSDRTRTAALRPRWVWHEQKAETGTAGY